MINLYSLSCLTPVPVKIYEFQRKGGTETKQNPETVPSKYAFLFIEKRL